MEDVAGNSIRIPLDPELNLRVDATAPSIESVDVTPASGRWSHENSPLTFDVTVDAPKLFNGNAYAR